jgi:hypothetical protein
MVWSNQESTSLVFPAGATTGARIVIDQNGIVIYDFNNHPIFVASPNGTVPGNDFTDSPVVFGQLTNHFPNTGSFGSQIFYDAIANVLTNLGPSNGNGAPGSNVYLGAQSIDLGTGNPIDTILQVVRNGYNLKQLYQLAGIDKNAGFKVGQGYPGLYYHEEFAIRTAQTLANAATTALTGMAQGVFVSDYASGMNIGTGIWTAPIDGIYTIEMSGSFSANATAAGVMQMILTNVKYIEYPAIIGRRPAGSVIAKLFMAAGFSVGFQVGNTTGVVQTLNGSSFTTSPYITIHREL